MISERAFARSFDSFWKELLPLLNPRFVSLFNEAYENDVRDENGRRLEALPVSPEVNHPDLVAEYAFRLARIAYQRGQTSTQAASNETLCKDAELEALRLIHKYDDARFTNVVRLSEEERAEGHKLLSRYECLYNFFPKSSLIEFCPLFPGAGFLDSCEGDLAVSSCLVEVKTTMRRLSGNDLRQVLVYCALSANAGGIRWREFGLFNPRRGTLHRAEIDPLVLRLSGGRPPLDVFSDLISFVEANDFVGDKRF